MASSVKNYQCPSCTGPLGFDAETGLLACEFCGSSYAPDAIEALYGARAEPEASAEKADMGSKEGGSSWSLAGTGEFDDAEAQEMRTCCCPSCGAAMAFMGMNMAQNAGGASAQSLYQMGQKAQSSPAVSGDAADAVANVSAAGWTCACGQAGNSGRFRQGCGAPQPQPGDGWICSCGAKNEGKFCSECGSPKPAGVPQYRCDKCGWEPQPGAQLAKFCPECGDPFDDGDIVR